MLCFSRPSGPICIAGKFPNLTINTSFHRSSDSRSRGVTTSRLPQACNVLAMPRGTRGIGNMRNATARLLGLAAASLPWMLAAAAPPAAPPTTPEHDVVEHYQGVQVHDPYQWLEQAGAPAVE